MLHVGNASILIPLEQPGPAFLLLLLAGAVSEADWGLCPGHVSGAGQEESIQQYYGSVRKCLKRYLQLLAEEGQLETLKAAGGCCASRRVWAAVVEGAS